MQIKIFTIPIYGGEALEDELNAFLRGRKILQVEQHLVQASGGNSWTFCVRYVEGPARTAAAGKRGKKDYKSELTEAAFARFTALRKVRKQLAEEDAVPAFAIFTDGQMAQLAQLDELTPQSMQEVSGIGEKKAAKYAARLLEKINTEEKLR